MWNIFLAFATVYTISFTRSVITTLETELLPLNKFHLKTKFVNFFFFLNRFHCFSSALDPGKVRQGI